MEPPHFTFENYFADEKILNLLGGHGFRATMTNRLYPLPEGVPQVNMCKEKTDAKLRKYHVTHFNNSITTVKGFPPTDDSKGYTRAHSTFQFTSSCNITTVNDLNDNILYVKQNERGRGPTNILRGIEMNSSRELYLKTYGAIDKMDHMIENARMHYRSWKHWHSTILNVKSMAVCTAYDMYQSRTPLTIS
jgi:hypothetical protein